MHPGHIEEWFQFAKNSLQNESGWKVAAQRSQDTLCYQDCLGGRTVKFDFKEIYVPGIDEPAEAMMRPEARSQSHDCKNRQIKLGLQQIVAPGDAFVEQTGNFWILFMIACLFGESGLQTDSFFCGCKPTLARHQRRLDFPEEGDCAYANFQGHTSGCQELMVIVRKASQRHHFRLMILFRVPDVELLLSWTSKSFVILLERSREELPSRPPADPGRVALAEQCSGGGHQLPQRTRRSEAMAEIFQRGGPQGLSHGEISPLFYETTWAADHDP